MNLKKRLNALNANLSTTSVIIQMNVCPIKFQLMDVKDMVLKMVQSLVNIVIVPNNWLGLMQHIAKKSMRLLLIA